MACRGLDLSVEGKPWRTVEDPEELTRVWRAVPRLRGQMGALFWHYPLRIPMWTWQFEITSADLGPLSNN